MLKANQVRGTDVDKDILRFVKAAAESFSDEVSALRR
jgi:hypothetical protein